MVSECFGGGGGEGGCHESESAVVSVRCWRWGKSVRVEVAVVLCVEHICGKDGVGAL